MIYIYIPIIVDEIPSQIIFKQHFHGEKTPFLPSKTHHFCHALPTSKERPQAPLEEGQERRREGRGGMDKHRRKKAGSFFYIFYQEKVIEQD